MPVQYLVITAIPPEGEFGNLAMAMPLFFDPQAEGRPFDSPHKPAEDVLGPTAIFLRQPVFCLGEILITRDGVRECSGRGRKPSKWLVEYERFDSVDDAINRSNEVSA